MHRYFGLPPKLLARKYRALRAAIAITHHDAKLADVLGDAFCDQSHFIRELRHFTGITPVALAQHPSTLDQQIAKRLELEWANPSRRTPTIM